MIAALRRIKHTGSVASVCRIAAAQRTAREFGALTKKPQNFVPGSRAETVAVKAANAPNEAVTGGIGADIFLRRGVAARDIVEQYGWTALERSATSFLQRSGPINVQQLRNFLGAMRAVPQVEHRRKLAALVKPELLRLIPTVNLTDAVNCLFYLRLTVPRSAEYVPADDERLATAQWLLQPVLERLSKEPSRSFKPEHIAKLYYALGQLSPNVDGMVQALEAVNGVVKQMNQPFSMAEIALWLSAFRTMPSDVLAAQASLKLLVATLQESTDKWTHVRPQDLTSMFNSMQIIGVETKECAQMASLLAEALEQCTTVNCVPLVCAALRCIHRAPEGSPVVDQLARALAQYLLLVDDASPQLRVHFGCMANLKGDTRDTQLLFQRLINLLDRIPETGKDVLRPTELINILDGARSLPPHPPELAGLSAVLGRKLSTVISRSHGGNLSHAMAQLSMLNDKLPGVPAMLHKLSQAVRSVDDLTGVRWARCVSGLANMHSDCPEALEVLDALREHLEQRNFKAPSSIVEIVQGIGNMDSSLPQVRRFVSSLIRQYFKIRQLPDQYLKLVELKDIRLDAELADQVLDAAVTVVSSGRIPAAVGLLALRSIDPQHPKLPAALDLMAKHLARSNAPASFETLLSMMHSLRVWQNVSTLDTTPILELLTNQLMQPETVLSANELTALCGAAKGLSDDSSMVALLLYHLTTRLAELPEPLTEQQVIQALPVLETLSVNKSTQLLTTITSKLKHADFVAATPQFVSALTHFRNYTSPSPMVHDLLLALAERLLATELKIAPSTVCEALIATAQCEPPAKLVDALLQCIDNSQTPDVALSTIVELCRKFEDYKFATSASRERFLTLLSGGIARNHAGEALTGEHLVLFLSKLQSVATNDLPYRTFVLSVASRLDDAEVLPPEQLAACMNVLQHFSAADAPAAPLLRFFARSLAALREDGSALSADEIRTAFWSLQRMDSHFSTVQDLMQQLVLHLDSHPSVSADVVEGMLYGLRNKHSCPVVNHVVARLADCVANMQEPLNSRALKALTTVRIWNERDATQEALRLAAALADRLREADVVLTPSLAKAVDGFAMRLGRSPHAETGRLREAMSWLLNHSPRS